ncbi:fasciclin domain-containing protein [Nocardioides sp. SYSU D00038]|uniref:fasciclin domain-containing protein n=1 Tax=Nocardioides sp. SYSU D00038 TaxID=2812554 RepID=UPI0019679837|nr:fasciclin domain-containing protein [Nocardioides sp. SYSU D00038]
MHAQRTKRILVTAVAGAVAAIGALAPATSAEAAPSAAGKRSLVKVLAADGVRFDKNWKDFDIMEAAALAVLDAKPDSPVGLLARGGTRLTAFLPTDRAFQRLVRSLTGSTPRTEKRTVAAILAAADVDTIETILLYHVVPARTLTSPKVVAAAKKGGTVTTAQGGTIKLHVIKGAVTLLDKDRDARNPRAIPALLDLNRGNRQVAHGIDRVLRPADL